MGRARPGDHITLKANPDFFSEGPYLEPIVFKYIPDLTVLYTQFQTGDIDYIGLQGITPDHYQEAKKLADRVVMPVALPFIENIAFNLGKPVFKDKAVREALYSAMDRKSDHRRNLLRPADARPNPTCLRSGGLQPEPAEAELRPREGEADPRRRRLGPGRRWRPREKRRSARLHQLDHRRQPCARTGAAAPAAELAGYRRQDDDQEHPARGDLGRLLDESKFDTVMVGRLLTGPDPGRDRLLRQPRNAKGGAGQNTMQYSNPDVDKLLLRRRTPSTASARRSTGAQAIVRADLPFLPLFQYAMVEGTKKALHGYTANVNTQSNDWNVNEWYGRREA